MHRLADDIPECEPENPHKTQLDHITIELQAALGDGADQEAWHPGEHWVLAVRRGLTERDRFRDALESIARMKDAEAGEYAAETAREALNPES